MRSDKKERILMSAPNFFMKRLIKTTCRRVGFDLVRCDVRPCSTRRPPVGYTGTVLEDIKARGLKCTSILDVGANEGRWTRLVASIFPQAKYFMIEPLEEMKGRLTDICQCHPGSRVFTAGAGSTPGRLTFTLMGSDERLSGSSFIPKESKDLISQGKQRTVPVVTIDLLIDQGEMPIPELVKLDVQGFELEALRGASQLFGRTEVFILEVSFFPFMSATRAMFHDVINFMHERDYVTYDFCGFIRRSSDGALAQADVCFTKTAGLLRRSSRW